MAGCWYPQPLLVVALLLPTLLQAQLARYTLNDTVVEQRAQDLMTSFWHWHLEEFPEFATEAGIPGYDDRVTEYTEKAFQERVRNATDFLAAIHELGNHGEIGHVTRTSLVVMEDILNTFVNGFEFRFQTAYLPCQVGFSPASKWQFVLARTVLNTHEDYDTLLKRLELIPTQISQLVALTEVAMKRGYLRNTQGLASSMEKMKINHITLPGDSIFYKPFVDMPSNINITSKDSLRQRALNIISDAILPALWKYWFVMTKKYLPATKEVPIGVYALPDGRALYRTYLNYHLSAPMTPEQVHQTGITEVIAITAKIHKVVSLIDNDNSSLSLNIGEILRYKFNSSHLYFNDSESMIAAYRLESHRIHENLNQVLLRIPDVPYRIEAAFSGPHGTYSDPSFTLDGVGVFSANVKVPHGPSTHLIPLLLHELEPGHHTQLAYIQTDEDPLPLFRRRLDYTNLFTTPFHFPVYAAYEEGWALYAEYLGEEMGLYDDPLARLGRLSNEMLRACRLVLDTGIHAYGWTRERAESYLSEHTGLHPDMVQYEVDRYIGRPGQACAYKIGEQKILEIRRRAESVLGSNFDIRMFHDRLLSLGPVPLRLLEEELYSWVTEVKANITINVQETTSMFPTVSCGNVNIFRSHVIGVYILFNLWMQC